MQPVPIGALGECEQTVRFEHTLTYHHPELPPVYSTPDMIRLMETAAFFALHAYCEGDEITVGTAINIEHRAASGIGARVKAEARLESFDGRFYVLRVRAIEMRAGGTDGSIVQVGSGTVTRAVVKVGEFLSKLPGGQRQS